MNVYDLRAWAELLAWLVLIGAVFLFRYSAP